MRNYLLFVLRRFGQFVLVVFLGITVTFIITHSTPIDPVEVTISAATAFGHSSPEAIELMRQSLTELYGLQGSAWDQYVTFWGNVLRGDFGPSLSAFPTPVSELIGRALPWTVGLLATSTVLAWAIGNLLGGLAGYHRTNPWLRAAGLVAMTIQPIPYYISAFVLLILFGYVWPIFPLTGGYQINSQTGWSLTFIGDVLWHSILPGASLVITTIGVWFMGMRALVSNIVSEDYVVYAELGGVPSRRILWSYVMRNALTPQITALAMSLGTIFSGAIITEQVYGYPGIGKLLIDGVNAGDYGLVLGVTAVSIIAVAGAVFIVDILYPLFDPRIRLG
ncbi:ABC transporter permease [Consotaella aegiceratis]|uniref:ABC transporter permease n=1 Tax=Consotaella aegiceratis TaxID=3097961 RepID=UPI002F404C53